LSVEVFRATPPSRSYRFELLPDDAMASALQLLDQPLGDDVLQGLDTAVARGLARALAFADAQATEQRPALVLLSGISSLPFREMRRRLEEHRPRFHSTDLCRLLCERSAEEAHHDPARALDFCRLGQRATDLLAGVLPPPIWHDAKAEAWAAVADTHRLAGRLRHAERALAAAWWHLRTGSGTLMVRAGLLIEQASLHCDQGRRDQGRRDQGRRDQERFDRGQRAIDQALCVLRAGAQGPEIARALVAKGRLRLESGCAEAALEHLEEALALAGDGADRALVSAAQHNRAAALCELGRFAAARQPLATAAFAAKLLSRPLAVLRLRWLEGRRTEGEDDFDTAAAAYAEALEGFLARRQRPSAAGVSADLARLCLGHRRYARALPLVVRAAFAVARHGKEAWPRRPITDRSW